MGILPIRIAGDPVLREKAKKVRTIDASVQKLIDDMIDTMRSAPGVGLAAPQVGQSLRVVVIETPDDGLLVLINPEVVKSSGERRVMEGCLSVPGYQAEITRSRQVTVKAQDRTGKEIRIKATDSLLAQALEHEIDHINGILYIDYLESADELIPVRPSIDDQDAREAEVSLA
ncbi:MAG TPA: peptide deformylase [Dehalococcoidia bacterium]|nr:peptide deformylase [Dehalococcoidia bacterium]